MYRKRNVYKRPMLITLEGNEILGADWGIFNFARPSRIKKWAPAIGTALVAIPTPVTQLVGAGLVTSGVVSAGVHSSYKKTGSNVINVIPGSITGKTEVKTEAAKKPVPWIPLAIVTGGVIAAIGIS